MPPAPNVLLIDIPADARGLGLSLGRYYPIILETESEIAELEDLICAPRDDLAPPDLFDHRPSRLSADAVLITRLTPPFVGWPWLTICYWPEGLAEKGLVEQSDLSRGRYTMEASPTAARPAGGISTGRLHDMSKANSPPRRLGGTSEIMKEVVSRAI